MKLKQIQQRLLPCVAQQPPLCTQLQCQYTPTFFAFCLETMHQVQVWSLKDSTLQRTLEYKTASGSWNPPSWFWPIAVKLALLKLQLMMCQQTRSDCKMFSGAVQRTSKRKVPCTPCAQTPGQQTHARLKVTPIKTQLCCTGYKEKKHMKQLIGGWSSLSANVKSRKGMSILRNSPNSNVYVQHPETISCWEFSQSIHTTSWNYLLLQTCTFKVLSMCCTSSAPQPANSLSIFLVPNPQQWCSLQTTVM